MVCITVLLSYQGCKKLEEATVMRRALGLCVLSGLSALMLGGCTVEAGDGDTNEAAAVQDTPTWEIGAPSGKGTGMLAYDVDPVGDVSSEANGEAKPGGTLGSATISYHGGPIITGTTNVYAIYYGDFSADGSNYKTVINSFLTSIGGSPYYGINTSYYNSANVHVSNSVSYKGSIAKTAYLGTSLTDANIKTIVSDAISAALLPKDTNALYFVLTSKNVTASSGFCTQYCGWHTYGTISGSNIKYSFVGNPAKCISSCAAQTTGPNANAGADGAVSIIAHELEEAVTDPQLNAWYDSQGYENADKCAWTFGTTSLAANGSKYNVTLGGKQYLIQRNWKASTNTCVMQ
jgi:hypothetical protein